MRAAPTEVLQGIITKQVRAQGLLWGVKPYQRAHAGMQPLSLAS